MRLEVFDESTMKRPEVLSSKEKIVQARIRISKNRSMLDIVRERNGEVGSVCFV